MLRLPGKKIILQEFTAERLVDPRYYGWLRDLEVVGTIGRLDYLMPIRWEEIEAYVQGLMLSDTDCFFSVHWQENDEFIGTFKLGHIDWRTGTADVGVMIGEKVYWGKGAATDAVVTGCDYAFRRLSLRKLTGGTPAHNTAMCRCFRRLGFQEEGRLRRQLLMAGEYIDHILFGVFREEFEAVLPPLRMAPVPAPAAIFPVEPEPDR